MTLRSCTYLKNGRRYYHNNRPAFFKISPEGLEAINGMIMLMYGKPVENLDDDTKVKAKSLWREIVKFVRANVKRFGEDDLGAKPEGMDPTTYWAIHYPLEKHMIK